MNEKLYHSELHQSLNSTFFPFIFHFFSESLGGSVCFFYLCSVFFGARYIFLLNRFTNCDLEKDERAISIHIGVHASVDFPIVD